VVDWKILLKTMKNVNLPIEIELPEQGTCYVFYKESTVLTRLRYFPFIQFIIILIFLVVAYLLFSYARKSEQNQVWVGMSKETAYQLGTPISALLAWNELLKENNVDETIITEIDKDLHRLETIAQRFSKIGSIPEFQPENIVTVLQDFVLYLQARLSKQIDIKFIIPENPEIIVPINRYLFEWVIENICKNSVDAIDGKGVILLNIIEEEKWVHIDISDTGKGISGQRQKSIFNPGYTSKKRGWGLGLTLAKRIIVEYHKGKLFVLKSLVGKGTTMRISLKKRAN
jgi:signal transduction histidine kinase